MINTCISNDVPMFLKNCKTHSFIPGVMLQILNMGEVLTVFCNFEEKRSSFGIFFLYILCKTTSPWVWKRRSGTVLGDNFSHVSLQDDPCIHFSNVSKDCKNDFSQIWLVLFPIVKIKWNTCIVIIYKVVIVC